MNLQDIDTQDTSKYRLIGKSVLSYQFAVPHDEPIFVGDILRITDPQKKLTFFAKVNDLLHDSNFSDSRWDTRPHSAEFYGLGEDVFLTVDATPLGYVDEKGKFCRPKTIPTKFSTVSKPANEDFRFLRDVMGEIEVGVMKTGQGVLQGVPVCLHSRVLPQHLGVFATTGMGKSNFMKTFCASCMKEKKFGVLMVDPHGEYLAGGSSITGDATLGLMHYTEGKRDGLEVFTTRKDSDRKMYSLKSLWLDYNDLKASDLLLMFEHSSPQAEMVESLEDFAGSDLIDFFLNTNFEDFDAAAYEGRHRGIADKMSNYHPGTLNVMKRRMDILVRSNSFLREKGSSVQEIITKLHENRVVLIDIPGMGERSELLVLSVLARRILKEHRDEAGGWGISEEDEKKQVLITIEEAQRVLGQGSRGTQVFRECAMEGRKFGVGLCVITQQPKNIDSRILAQINTFVVMGLGDRSDRSTVASSAKQDLSSMDTEIQTLDRGEAIISSPGIPFPVSTKIHKFEDYLRILNKEGTTSSTGTRSRRLTF